MNLSGTNVEAMLTFNHVTKENERLKKEISDLKFRLSRVQKIVEDGYQTMPYSNLNHEQMAGKVRMLMRDTLEHEAICTGARDRIIYLANQVEDLKAAINESLPDNYKILKDTTQEERSWPGDFQQENGNYHNTCCSCGRMFIGNKHRLQCRVCSAELSNPGHDPETLENFMSYKKPIILDSYSAMKPESDLFSYNGEAMNTGSTKKMSPAQVLLDRKRKERLSNMRKTK